MAFIPCYPPGNMPDECVYIIALERPACAPTRVKIGYTRNLQRRLKAFRTTYPNAVVIWTRAGTRKTERDLLAEARRFPQAFPIEKSEVFEFSDLNGFVRDIAENLIPNSTPPTSGRRRFGTPARSNT